jgi:hypothetical protein
VFCGGTTGIGHRPEGMRLVIPVALLHVCTGVDACQNGPVCSDEPGDVVVLTMFPSKLLMSFAGPVGASGLEGRTHVLGPVLGRLFWACLWTGPGSLGPAPGPGDMERPAGARPVPPCLSGFSDHVPVLEFQFVDGVAAWASNL